MDTQTGKIIPVEQVPAGQPGRYVQIRRDLTVKEAADKQIRMYSPCGCGSGKNFKFCCYKPATFPVRK